jgi:hypothetical protein
MAAWCRADRGGRRGGPRRASTTIVATALLLLATHAAAADTLNLRYEARWAGLKVADIVYALHADARSFEARMTIVTRGLAWLFTKFEGRARALGAVAGGALMPRGYDAVYDLRKRKDKRAVILYRAEPEGRLAYRGAGDTSDHPELEKTHRRNVLDPLTAFAAIRQRLEDPMARRGGAFVLPVYDDQRRFDAAGAVTGRETLRLGGRAVAALRIDMVLRPVAGFQLGRREEDPEDRPRPVRLFLSDDENLTPLRAEVPIAFFTTVIELAADCGGNACALPR